MMRKLVRLIRILSSQFLIKIIRLFQFFEIQTLVIDQLEKIRINVNKYKDYKSIISELELKRKIYLLDVGSLDFDFEKYFPLKYEEYFKVILVEPNPSAAINLVKNKKYQVVNKAFWSSECKKKLYLTSPISDGSSMYLPSKEGFDLYNPDDNYFANYKISKEIEVECTTIDKSLSDHDVKYLDYLKIHAQGAELEILKGLGRFKPLILNVKLFLTPMYENIPDWTEILSYLKKLNYISCSWEKVGSSIFQCPAQMNMLFIPNFLNDKGKKSILERKDEFIFLMLLTGQIKLLQTISNKINLKLNTKIAQLKDYYF